MTQASDLTIEDDVTDLVEEVEQDIEELETSDDNEVERDEDPSDSSEDTAEKPEPKITFSPEQQAVVDKLAAEKTFKLREAERKADRERNELRRELDDLRRKLPSEKRPDVPKYPDRYDFDTEQDFQAAVRNRDQAIAATYKYDARQEATAAQRAAAERQGRMEQQEQLVKTAETYTQVAQKLGVKAEELQQAGNMVAQYGLSEDLAAAILSDDHGPLITTYLARNVNALDSLVRANPYQAGMILAQVKQEAAKTKRAVSRAPAPADHLHGNGARPSERGPKGARFE